MAAHEACVEDQDVPSSQHGTGMKHARARTLRRLHRRIIIRSSVDAQSGLPVASVTGGRRLSGDRERMNRRRACAVMMLGAVRRGFLRRQREQRCITRTEQNNTETENRNCHRFFSYLKR